MVGRPKAYDGTEPYIFISYAHLDSERVMPIIAGLQERGFRIWYDAGIEAGTEWPEYIAEHLDGCSNVLAFISKHSLDSHNCRREIHFAIELEKEPLVIYLEDVQMTLGMRMQLNSLQAIYYNRQDSLNSFMQELCSSEMLMSCREESVPDNADVSVDGFRCGQMYRTYYQAGRYFKAFEWAMKGAEQGDAQAMDFVGKCYELGEGVPKDDTVAAQWYLKAAELGNNHAQCKIGELYLGGKGIPQNFEEGFKWALKASEKYNSQADLMLYVCYSEGVGVLQDMEEAMRRLVRSAKWGNADAEYELAAHYMNGDVVEENPEEALKLFHRAAEKGCVEAQSALGFHYSRGIYVEQDSEKGITWYRKAAEQGDSNAQYQLGCIYEEGRGVPADKEQAVKWYRLAADQGEVYALKALLKMGY